MKEERRRKLELKQLMKEKRDLLWLKDERKLKRLEPKEKMAKRKLKRCRKMK